MSGSRAFWATVTPSETRLLQCLPPVLYPRKWLPTCTSLQNEKGCKFTHASTLLHPLTPCSVSFGYEHACKTSGSVLQWRKGKPLFICFIYQKRPKETQRHTLVGMTGPCENQETYYTIPYVKKSPKIHLKKATPVNKNPISRLARRPFSTPWSACSSRLSSRWTLPPPCL